MPSPFSPGSPLATSGKRVRMNVAPAARMVVSEAAAEFGITQRMIVDEVLGRRELMREVARELRERVFDPPGDPEPPAAVG